MAGLYVCLMFMSVLVSSAVLKKSAGYNEAGWIKKVFKIFNRLVIKSKPTSRDK